MKNLLILILFIFLSELASGQKIVEKGLDINSRPIDVEFKFAENIVIKTWEKPSIHVKAEIWFKGSEFQESYELKIDDNSSLLKISDNSEKVLKDLWEELRKQFGDDHGYFNSSDYYSMNYEIQIPKGTNFTIHSINGSLTSELIDGEFTADLINGNITIAEYSGNLDLQTINGEIELTLKDVSFSAETINGNIYTDENLEYEYEDRYVGQKIRSKVNNATNKLKLNTINGTMFLRL